MSLLLSSLKKADEKNQQSAQPAEAATSAVAGTPAAAAPASGGSSLNIQSGGATPGAAAGVAAVDFDNIGGGASGGGTDAGDENLVSASRIFRAGEDSDSAKEGGSRRTVVGLLALLIIVGGGAGVLVGELIPGVNVSSVLRLIGYGEAPQVVQRRDTGPVLEAISGDDAALSLPRPLVDVQSGIAEFAAFRNEGETLSTPQGRRELAEKLVGFVEEPVEEDIILPEEDLQIIGQELDEGAIILEEEVAEVVIKTAAAGRDLKRSLDSRTPSDRVLSRSVTRNTAEGVVVIAQATTEETEETAETAGADEESAVADIAEPVVEEKAIAVKPSLKGEDRRRLLNEAGRLYVGGAYPEAEAAYRNILSKNATNLDALRGLALVAVATGRYQLAVATYLKILEYYPNDPVAVADLTNLHGVSGDNFYTIESALKKVIGERPEWDSRLHFALGNLYAGAERWTDAQKSYFNAYSAEQTNPDYAYNLAVVLDYLNKPGLALTYYREALELSAVAPSGFDAARVRSRIADISQ